MRRKSQKGRDHDTHSDFLDDLEPTSIGAKPSHPQDFIKSSTPATTRFEDRRRWAPGRLASPREPAREVSGRPARIVHKVTSPSVRRGPGGKPLQSRKTVVFSRTLSDRPIFKDVKRTIICLKRKTRAEVLFALKRTGKGARTPKRRNEWSDIKC